MTEVFAMLQAQDPNSGWLAQIHLDILQVGKLVPDIPLLTAANQQDSASVAQISYQNPKALTRLVKRASKVFIAYTKLWVGFRKFHTAFHQEAQTQGVRFSQEQELPVPAESSVCFQCHVCHATFDTYHKLCTHAFSQRQIPSMAQRYVSNNVCRACLKMYKSRQQVIHHLKYMRTGCLVKLVLTKNPLTDAELADLHAEQSALTRKKKAQLRSTDHKVHVCRASGPLLPWPWQRCIQQYMQDCREIPQQSEEEWNQIVHQIGLNIAEGDLDAAFQSLHPVPYHGNLASDLMQKVTSQHGFAVTPEHGQQQLLLQELIHLWQDSLTVLVLPPSKLSQSNVKHDVYKEELLSTFKLWVSTGWVAGLLIAPPCETWSEVRNLCDDEALPRPLRSSPEPLCIEALKISELEQLEVSNHLLFVAIRLVWWTVYHSVPSVTEHPRAPKDQARASIWRLPWYQHLFQQKLLIKHDIYQARFGSASVKPTTFAVGFLPRFKQGIQTFHRAVDWKALTTLSGKDNLGGWKTSQAKEYPPDLNAALAWCFVDALRWTPQGIKAASEEAEFRSTFSELYAGDVSLEQQVIQPDFHGVTLSVPEIIAKTARTGGISAREPSDAGVLITSATDALAFLVGATTVLPALSWFCTYAGVSIVLCYTFQLTVFLPCLALNARRTAASKMDCCCCFTRPERSLDDAQGCCCCCLPRSAFKGGRLKQGAQAWRGVAWEEKAPGPRRPCPGATLIGRQVLTFVLFAVVSGVGIFGTTQIYKESSWLRVNAVAWYLRAMLHVKISLPSGRTESLSVPDSATAGDLKMLAQQLFGQRFLRLVADGRILAHGESLQAALQDGDHINAVSLPVQDFKLEWFIPDSSYVPFGRAELQQWQALGPPMGYFATGTPITVNFPESDVFAMQSGLRDVYGYLNSTSLVNQDQGWELRAGDVAVDSWYEEFMEWATDEDQAPVRCSDTPGKHQGSSFFGPPPRATPLSPAAPRSRPSSGTKRSSTPRCSLGTSVLNAGHAVFASGSLDTDVVNDMGWLWSCMARICNDHPWWFMANDGWEGVPSSVALVTSAACKSVSQERPTRVCNKSVSPESFTRAFPPQECRTKGVLQERYLKCVSHKSRAARVSFQS
eukprot:Skav206359  [mRNA]  locus=scaffold3448:259694:272924:- [translate_table: standard]